MTEVRFEDPNWPRASAWLAGGLGGSEGSLGVLGAPLVKGAITPGRFDFAPGAIRQALERFSTWDFDAGLDIASLEVSDFGNLRLQEERPDAALGPLSGAVRNGLESHQAMAILGGHNGITWAGVHGLGNLDKVGLITVDAHLDLRSLDQGLVNGNPVRALLQDGLRGQNIVQLGIQSFANSPAYAHVARDAGIEVVTAESVRREGIAAHLNSAFERLSKTCERIYVDLDLDVLDRAFAPATAGSRPGGLTPAEVRLAAHLCGRHPMVAAIDLVEIDPTRDVSDVTVMTAASVLLAFASGVLERARTASVAQRQIT